SIAGPLTFRTPCVTTQTPFFESFEDGIPSCWTVIDNDGQGRTWTATSEYTHTGNGAVRVQWETNAHDDYLITPHFTVQEGITDQVSFYMGKNSISWNETFEVLISTTGKNPGDFVLIASESAPSYYEEFSYDISQYDGQDVYVAVKATSTNQFYIYLDDFSVGSVPSGYVYEDGVWTPEDPSGVATSSDDITVINGSTTVSNVTGNNITINEGASLDVTGILNVHGDLTIDGNLTFKSSATGNGELGVINGTITGNATVERYMQDVRSYRMVSSAVTTSSSIHANWQEGATSRTHNPAPGYGTHITG